jgi:hypothetical protein
MSNDSSHVNRRTFITGLTGAAFALTPFFDRQSGTSIRPQRPACLVVDPADEATSTPRVRRLIASLHQGLSNAGFAVRHAYRIQESHRGDFCIVIASSQPAVRSLMKRASVTAADGPEGVALFGLQESGRDVLVASGSDARGLTYAIQEIQELLRVDPAALTLRSPIVERPANAVRSVMRQYTSEALDSGWLNDRAMWPAYLEMLSQYRFNRLHLAFGLGYDTLQQVTDSHLLFLYPFVLNVPGYAVRATNVPADVRDRNLETLRFISEQTAAHGLTFQLGIWMHGYQLINSPAAKYVIEGLTPDNHAAYCRDALTALLRACPAISAVALRIHGESGIAEGSYDFWQTVFDGVPRCGRVVEIDLHAKGLDQKMIDRALATGMPVNVSPKYWAEHLGMPYHQASIRDLEMPVAGQTGRGLMTLSEGSLSFTRYGYADFLRDDRKYTVRHRVFSGTQRLLLSGDPAATAAYSRAFEFCGSTGADLMEPLTCRGRRGTGVPGTRRSGYADGSLETQWDWEKYRFWYRTWGRLLYNPDTDASVWPREFAGYGNAAAIISGLSSASRILPIVTTAHLPSAACDAYWPEVYWNQPLAAEPRPNPYGDSSAPKTFQHTSPLDPQLFSNISEHASELLGGTRSGKYSPVDVAQWLEALASAVSRDIGPIDGSNDADSRRVAIDAHMQADLGRFFAAKLRAGVLYAIHERTGNQRALDRALECYRTARQAWAELTKRAQGVYAADLSASDKISERGQWADRLAAIDADIAAVASTTVKAPPSTPIADDVVAAAIDRALSTTARRDAACTHTPPSAFTPRVAVPLTIDVAEPRAAAVVCCYRHVNQAERFQRVTMESRDATFHVSIPGEYTDSPYPLQYYFIVSDASGDARLYPGLGPDRMRQPYFVLRRSV